MRAILDWYVSRIFGEVHARKGVATGQEPLPEIRLGPGLGSRSLQTGPQLVQERRAFAVGDHLEFRGYGCVHELAPVPGRGLGRCGGRGMGSLYLVREGCRA